MKLKNCPFCGKECVFKEYKNIYIDNQFKCGCQTPGCRGNLYESPSYYKFVVMFNKWNMRKCSMDKVYQTSHKKDSDDEKTPEFYKNFYDYNRVRILQYESLRKHFKKLVDDVLGKDYYNMGMDVYECDRICCKDLKVKFKSNNFITNLFGLN